jgi:hypothetical protein
VEEAIALAGAGRDARLTITAALDHVSPRPRPGLLLVAALVDRLLARAEAAHEAALRPAVAA